MADAVWESRRMRIRYRRGDAGVERVVDPLGLVLKGGIWYVVALTDGDVRTYRARRILEAEPTGEVFGRPAGFDLAAHWTESIAAYESAAPRVTVTVRVNPDALGVLADLVGERALRRAERLDGVDADGWYRLRISVDWPDEVPGRLLAVGGGLEILDPPEVRDRALELARGAIERHAHLAQ
jgi:predicted DNA-binding transcriptional regulator YafY